MNFFVPILLIAVQCLLQSTAQHPPASSDESKVIGGSEAKPHEYPYAVSLESRFLFLRMHICGGALIHRSFILSAAHCATESWLIRWLPMDAVAGVHDTNNFMAQTQIIPIFDRIPHPLYNGGIGPHDIALFKTIRPFILTKIVQPISLSLNYNSKSGDSLKLIGWGALRTTSFIPELPSGLQEANVKYIPYDDCHKAIEDLRELDEPNPLDDESNICTGPLTGGIAACVGDSGGPLIRILDTIIPPPNDSVEQSTENYYTNVCDCENTEEEQGKAETVKAVLLGIVSWGVSPCGEVGAPTVYTNVSAYRYFIEYNIKNN